MLENYDSRIYALFFKDNVRHNLSIASKQFIYVFNYKKSAYQDKLNKVKNLVFPEWRI